MTDPKPKSVPFCVNCLHYIGHHKPFHYCDKEQTTSPVTGEPVLAECGKLRAELEKCGKDGSWFEQK